MLPRIEENLGETLYREYFFPCKTFELQAKDGSKRRFVEYAEASDFGADLCFADNPPDMALKNVVRRLLLEKNYDFFFDKEDEGVNAYVWIDNDFYFLKSEDISAQWGNHYWTKAKIPIVGFKTIAKNGKSVLPSYVDADLTYEIGGHYSVSEETMLQEMKGFYFSQQLQKALSYATKDTITCMVVVTGLIFIKNQWNDMCAQNMTIVGKLTQSDIKKLCPSVNAPKAFWNGIGWDSHDEDFYNEYIWNL